MPKNYSWQEKLGRFIKGLDTFGTPVSLTYKNEP